MSIPRHPGEYLRLESTRGRHAQPRLRLLCLDASPGAATLLVLAAQRAIPGFDTVLIPDTGWFPEAAYPYLARLQRLAADAGMAVVWADAGPIAEDSLASLHPCPLPLFTRAADGTPGRLPQGCARRQAAALTSQARSLLGYSRPTPVPSGLVAECAVGLGVDQAHRATAASPRFLSLRYPLADIGWSTRDCYAYLHHHDLAPTSLMACVACPNRSNAAWAELRTTDPVAFEEACAVDAALRHGHPIAALRPMPPGTTYYLHSECVPLGEVALDAVDSAEESGCLPWACRGSDPGTRTHGGGAA